eukprot:CAMPEP_0202867384 /NCGR_PEP_ID=MMETSP1391-20130828/9316_1 /ASSEMBLY_ACC=CAM_ASM_000867 /TAXON_ID=1034604 /ORGANISM="Chlamydomonas leiostraca, Strain SAG 11-49" /LENGTH=214 /DNA_ID=CAMNT_0049547427 /DNA_START=57 /DNA_END=701 /DNA_ORIENTATION=+
MALTRSTIGKLAPSTSALFVCDLQERFKPVIHGWPAVEATAKRMIKGANALNIPVVVTEQYPKALGRTVPEIKEVLPPAWVAGMPATASHHRTFEKTLFSMVTPEVEGHLKTLSHVKQVMLLGIETHVCVVQTALDLVEKGYEVHLIVDGASSQREADRAVALQRMAQSGVLLASSEMALFQLARVAEGPGFKAISAIAKEAADHPRLAITSCL